MLLRIGTGVVPYLSHQAQYVGRAGVIGFALLSLSLAGFLVANSPLRHQVAQLQQSLTAKQRERLNSHGPGIDAAPGEQLQTFVKTLPAREQLPALTERIVAEASAAGIALERGSYDFSVTHSGRIVRARLTFPINGSYPNIRQFVNGTLSAIPGAAVDGLKLERKDIGAGEIGAEIRFAIFLRNEP